MEKFLSLSCLFLMTQSVVYAGQDWINPTGRDIQTIFYQGLGESQTQLSKYVGPRGFIATTGEHVVCQRGIDIIERPFVGREIDEVVLRRNVNSKYPLFTYIKEAIRHPVRTIFELRNWMHNRLDGITIKQPVAQNCTETINAHSLILKRVSIGQDNDIANHQMRYDQCVGQHPGSDLVFFGPSRGAATTFSALAANPYDLNKIRLIILEGCFDTVPHVLKMRHPWLLGLEGVRNVALRVLARMTGFKLNGRSPLSLVDSFPVGVPVIFITSAVDTSVNPRCTQCLIDALKRRGSNPIYKLMLKRSSHPHYMMDDTEDTENYRDCLHALYRRLNLPYIPEYAQSGEQKGLLERCLLV